MYELARNVPKLLASVVINSFWVIIWFWVAEKWKQSPLAWLSLDYLSISWVESHCWAHTVPKPSNPPAWASWMLGMWLTNLPWLWTPSSSMEKSHPLGTCNRFRAQLACLVVFDQGSPMVPTPAKAFSSKAQGQAVFALFIETGPPTSQTDLHLVILTPPQAS